MTERIGRMSAVMQELVSGAHSTRDGVFNTLDAVGRRTRSAHAALVDRVRTLRTEPADPPDEASEAAAAGRDTRFDPEDEWELSVRGANAAPADSTGFGPRAGREADDEEFPQTWLR